jgi:hypothetical protein
MAGKGEQRQSELDRPLSMRAIVIGGALVVVMGAAAVTALLYFYGGGTEQDRAGLDLVRTAGMLVVATSGFIALLLVARRQWSTEQTLEQSIPSSPGIANLAQPAPIVHASSMSTSAPLLTRTPSPMPRGATPGRNLGEEVATGYAGAWWWTLRTVDPDGYSVRRAGETYSPIAGKPQVGSHFPQDHW